MGADDRTPRLAVIVPVYHNAPSLPILHCRLKEVAEQAGVRLTIVYVDDRSGDDSYAVLRRLARGDRDVGIVRLSRNFGSFTAIRAGMDHAGDADCHAILSADLQDPPEMLLEMLQAWREGSPVVLAVRARRADGWFTRLTSGLFYRLVRRLALPQMPIGGFDFLLIDRKVTRALAGFTERNTSLVGLILWLGFERKLIPYDRQPRPFGRSMWSLARKLNYFVDTFVAFSVVPLRLASAAGLVVSLAALLWGAFVVFQAIFLARPIPGWSSLMSAVCVLGGIQLLGMGILGEYLWRNLEEARGRPLYVVDRTHGRARRLRARPRTRLSRRSA